MPLNGEELWLTDMGASGTQAKYYLESLEDDKYELDHTDKGATSGSVISEADQYKIPGFTFKNYVPGVWTDEEN